MINDPLISEKVILNEFGFYQLREIPDAETLKKYYESKYYQNDKGHYSKQYSQDELTFLFNKLEQKYYVINKRLNLNQGKLLDIGSGEGWALNFFKRKGWEVVGIDYSDFGCKTHNPDCIPQLIIGDIDEKINDICNSESRYDVVWLDNVLEHVPDPSFLLKRLYTVTATNGILVVEVPNDFSVIQEELLKNEHITKPFWIAIPDHISYFNLKSLLALSRQAGWDNKYYMSDFPIDFNLFNEYTNYIKNPSVGKSCHHARVELENIIHNISVEKAATLFHSYADLGLGRQIIAFFQKN